MLLHAADLRVSYGQAEVLRGVSLDLAPGRVVALLGPNGSGKSTLLAALLGQRESTGTIEWDGVPLARRTRREMARLVAYLPQAPTSEPGQRVIDVLRVGRAPYWGAFGVESERDEQIVLDAADAMGLKELLERPMDALSGGQRQRVYVGRCLAQEPRALLLDEPATYLDVRHGVELCRLLRTLANERGLAVLMASHEFNVTAAVADQLVLLHEGRVAAAGKADEVLDEALLRRVYGVPMEVIRRAGQTPVVVPEL